MTAMPGINANPKPMLAVSNHPSGAITTASLGLGAVSTSRPNGAMFHGWGPRF